jgi:hypothetical protein
LISVSLLKDRENSKTGRKEIIRKNNADKHYLTPLKIKTLKIKTGKLHKRMQRLKRLKIVQFQVLHIISKVIRSIYRLNLRNLIFLQLFKANIKHQKNNFKRTRATFKVLKKITVKAILT